MRATLIIPPGHHKLTVPKASNRRLVLRATIGISINQELITNLGRGDIKALTKDVNARALAGICSAVVITPGDDETTVIETGD